MNTNTKTCCICGRKFHGYGNNPEPVKHSGVCCDTCNMGVVLATRILNLKGHTDHEK